MDYAYRYKRSRSKYYEACSEITDCENSIRNLKSQRQQTINLINKLRTDIKNNQEAFDKLSQIIKSEDILQTNFRNINHKTESATSNYTNMVKSSDIVIKNLCDVYQDETTKTKQTLSNIIKTLRDKKNMLKSRIEDLKMQLSNAEATLSDIENRIRATESDLNDWKRIKMNASRDMEYYRRKMEEEEEDE